MKNPIVLSLLLFISIIAVTQVTDRRIIAAPVILVEETDHEIALDEDPWNDLQQIVHALQSRDGITYSGTILLVDETGENRKLIEKSPFTYTVFNDAFYYSLGGVEVISKEHFTLLVDHGSKTIALTKKMHAEKTAPFNVDAFQKLLDQRESTIRLAQLDTERILTIDHIMDPVIQGYRVYYNPRTYRVRKIEIGMASLSAISNEKEEHLDVGSDQINTASDEGGDAIKTYTYYLEIEYKDISKWQGKKASFLPENEFITGTSHHIHLTNSFKDYTFLNAENQ